ncbi:hypothetical protein Goshw_017365 [Gossypium schwendimanii]|uniref:Thioredoxin domain-containing protein n=1 Tax=Gossypium schwendimanii TaxID=34291 RepID=A0A7J9M4K4_GOSSC|nr:hypothetical protein [Gossypium schwendimanii]
MHFITLFFYVFADGYQLRSLMVSRFECTGSLVITQTSYFMKCFYDTAERVCSQILPAFCKLSNQFPNLSFVYADIDECPETTQHIRYTPTFHFYRDGERVDEMFGAGEERLHDRLWLHS